MVRLMLGRIMGRYMHVDVVAEGKMGGDIEEDISGD